MKINLDDETLLKNSWDSEPLEFLVKTGIQAYAHTIELEVI